MEKELAKLAEKYEAKKKELKVVEKELSGLKSQFEKDRAVFNERMLKTQQQLHDQKQKYEQELADQRIHFETQDENNVRDIEVLDEEVDRHKNQILDLERELSDVTSNYERDKALWKEKFEFLENQKRQAKEDLKEAQKKFELTIEQLQKKETNDKGKVESAQLVLIGSIEKKYKDQIKDIQETNVAREKEHQKKVRNLEK